MFLCLFLVKEAAGVCFVVRSEMQAGVYASCVSIGRHRSSSGFVLQAARSRITNAGQTWKQKKNTDFFFFVMKNLKHKITKMWFLLVWCLQISCLVDSMLPPWKGQTSKFPWERKKERDGGEREREREREREEGEAPRCAFLSAQPAIIYARFRAVHR